MKAINLVLLFTVNILLICGTILAQTDFKIKKKSRLNMPGVPTSMKNPQTGEPMDFGKLPDSTVLIKGARMLTETRTDKAQTGTKTIFARLRQCDLGRELSYTNKSKKYQVTNFSFAAKTTGKSKTINKESGGSVVLTMTYTDTGERAQMFGYAARRVKSVLTTKPSPDACQKKAIKIETDGWYIDLPATSCPLLSPDQPDGGGGGGEQSCNDKVIYQVNGKMESGFAVKETKVMTLDGMEPITMIDEVTEITKTDFDAALFDVPPGYTEDKNSGGKNANNTAPASVNDNNSSSNVMTSDDSALVPTMPTTTSATALQPTKPGVIRIGIAKPNMKLPDSKDDTTAPLELSAAVRDSLMTNFKTETVEAIRLETDAPEAEAKRNHCDYIFYANVTQKRGGGMFGKMVAMGAMTVVGAMVPGVGGMIAGQVGSMVLGQQMGKAAKAKDEFTFDYKVTDLNNGVLSQAVTKAKTKKDGEDVLTPQIKQASTVVLGEIAKKK